MNTLQTIYNLLLIPLDPDFFAQVWLVIAAFTSLACCGTMLYLAFHKRFISGKNVKIIYTGIAIIMIWMSIIYFLAIFHVLGTPLFDPDDLTLSYGNYIRPILAPLLYSPALIALLHRRVK